MLTNSTNRVYNAARKANFRRMGLAIQWPEAFLSRTFQSLKLGELAFPAVAKLGKEWHALLSSWIAARLVELRANEKPSAASTDMIVPIMRYKDPDTGEGLNDADMTAELTTLLIAGSGTITTGMTSIIWYLSRDAKANEKAVTEVRSTFNSLESIRMGQQLSSCVYLRACLREAMRMSPAPTTPLYREAGPGGATACGIHIPEGYEVATTIYALHHNELYHPDSFSFQPERWLGDDHAGVDAAWAPFSYGPRNCVGLSLATNEVLLAVASLLWQGDLRISDDPQLASIGAGSLELGLGRTRKSEFQMYDTFGASTEGPYLQFRKRTVR